jgi:hypothetical protein
MGTMARIGLIHRALQKTLESNLDEIKALEMIAMTGALNDLIQFYARRQNLVSRNELRKILQLPQIDNVEQLGGIFRKAMLGMFPDVSGYISAFKQHRIKGMDDLGDWVQQKDLSKTPSISHYVRVSGYKLGFNDWVDTEKIIAPALELGMRLCTREDGPALRLAYLDQPNEEILLIPTDQPVVYAKSIHTDLNLLWMLAAQGGALHLSIEEAEKWSPESEYVFRVEKQNLVSKESDTLDLN